MEGLTEGVLLFLRLGVFGPSTSFFVGPLEDEASVLVGFVGFVGFCGVVGSADGVVECLDGVLVGRLST